MNKRGLSVIVAVSILGSLAILSTVIVAYSFMNTNDENDEINKTINNLTKFDYNTSVCVANSKQCLGNKYQTCNSQGTAWILTDTCQINENCVLNQGCALNNCSQRNESKCNLGCWWDYDSASCREISSKILVRQKDDGTGEFYDASNDQPFLPRGNNYYLRDSMPVAIYQPLYSYAWIILENPYTKEPILQPGGVISEQDVYMDYFNSDLKIMKDEGYNTIRVFLDSQLHTSSEELNEDYLDYLVNLLRVARKNNLHVIFSSGFIPKRYNNLMPPISEDVEDFNNYLLNPGSADALGSYLRDTLNYINKTDPSLINTIFSLELLEEPFFVADKKPFSLTGDISLYGKTYDMSDATSRQELADESTTNWLDKVGSKVKSKYPNILTSVSLIAPLPNSRGIYGGYNGVYSVGGRRIQSLRLKKVAENPNIDYIDFHVYPSVKEDGTSYSFDKEMTSSELVLKNSRPYVNDVLLTKPLIISEYGSAKAYSIKSALDLLKNLQIDSTKYNFSGWLLWVWSSGSGKTETSSFWDPQEEDFLIGEELSPIERPNPGINLCRGKDFYINPGANKYCCLKNYYVSDNSVALTSDIYGRYLCYNGQIYSHISDNSVWNTISKTKCEVVGDYYADPGYPFNYENISGWKPLKERIECGENLICKNGACVSDSSNLINNPSFSDNNIWQLAQNTSIEISDFNKSSKSLHIQGYGFTLQNISIFNNSAGKKFELSFWAKTDFDWSANWRYWATAGIQNSTNWQKLFYLDSGAWAFYNYTFIVDWSDPDMHEIVLGTQANTPSSINTWFDDVRLVEV